VWVKTFNLISHIQPENHRIVSIRNFSAKQEQTIEAKPYFQAFYCAALFLAITIPAKDFDSKWFVICFWFARKREETILIQNRS
jgi:hypothetical protein